MSKLLRICGWVALFLMATFLCVGYAQVNTGLTVEGEATYTPPDAVYIIDISNFTENNVTVTTSPYNIDEPSTKMLSEITFLGKNASLSFDVTIVNHTKATQIYDTLIEHDSNDGLTSVFGFAGVDFTVSPGQGTSIPSGGRQTFRVTYKYTGTNTSTAQTRYSLYSFGFVLDPDDLTQLVSEGITGTFANILNNGLEEDVSYTYEGTTYTIPKDGTYNVIDKNMEGSKPGTFSTGRFMGNLSGADPDDKAILTALFGEQLTFKIGDEEVPVTIMMKEKDVYGSEDYEMVLYITADDLQKRSTYVPVYAVVFSKDDEGVWQQIGDIMAGEARTNAYSGLPGKGSFNTETWRSTAVYYTINVGAGIDALMNAYKNQNP